MEHTDIGNDAFADLARGMQGRGIVPMARVRENDTLAIRQVLDMGAEGVIVPLVHTAADAERAVAAAKYPPRGVRGYAFSRMNDWGRKFDDYAAAANDEIAVVVMIESGEGVENIDAILAVDGVDGVFIGPYDLSGSCGVPGQTSHPDVTAGCTRVVRACCNAGKAAGIHLVIPAEDAIADAVEKGFTFLGLGVDTVFLNESAAAAVRTVQEIQG
jgi:2-keto-3-deoxy-L-rhamnonate aldolase RhmA